MNNEIINLDNFSNTRETLSQRSIRCMSIFVYIVCISFVVFILWAAFMPLDITVRVAGKTETDMDSYIGTSNQSGIIVSIHKNVGTKVSVGDKLFTVQSYENGEKVDHVISSESEGSFLLSHGIACGTSINEGDYIYQVIPEGGNAIIHIAIPENEFEQIKVGQKVKVRIPGVSSLGKITGRIRSISNIVSSGSGNSSYIKAIVQLDDFANMKYKNQDQLLPIGMNADVVIHLGEQTVLVKILKVLKFIS